MSKPLVHSFKTKSKTKISEVGGKAQSLIIMTKEKFLVPKGFVLTVEFFKPWMEKIEKSLAWKKFLKSSEKNLQKNCDEIKKRCSTLKLSQSQKESLNIAIKKIPKNSLLAVRSSSPEEDLEGTSFAGVYETTLGVTQKTLEKAIIHSFKSLFDERIVKYKIQNNMNTDRPRIAIIVQTQIASDVSGVAFSLNPQNNCYDEAVINSSFGLGEMVVSGQVTPDTFIVDKPKRKIVERKISDKDHALWLTPNGGTEEKENKNPSKPSLTNKQAKEVAKLTADVEKYYQKPMDIEWAYFKNKLYLLQARPITAYFPLPPEMITKPGAQKYVYVDSNLMEQGFGEPLSVLGGGVFREMMDLVMRKQFGLKSIEGVEDGLLAVEQGKAYLQLSNTVKAFGIRGLKSVFIKYDKPTGQILGSIDYKKEYIPEKKSKKLKGIVFGIMKVAVWMGWLALKAYISPEKELKKYQKRMKDDLKSLKVIEKKQGSYYEIFESAIIWLSDNLEASYAMLFAPMLARRKLGKIFKKEDAEDLLIKLEMALPGNPTSEMGYLMYHLAVFPEVQKCKDGKTFAKKLKARSFPKKFHTAYDDFMKRYGFRCIKEIDVGTSRPYENPELFFDQLKSMRLSKKGEENIFKSAERKQKESYKKLHQLAVKIGKRKSFEKNAKIIRDMAGYREVPKYYFVMAVDLLHKKALEIGEKFVKQGRLDSTYQIFDLTLSEVGKAEKDKTMELRSLTEENTEYQRLVKDFKDWPRAVDSRGKIFRAVRESGLEGGLIGDAISPGIIRGRAKVLHDPHEKPLKKGEILVTRATDPGWTPLFMNAAGVVLEVGAALQHGPVIAREYGLPCVSGIDGAASIIKDGQLIEVDGSNGTVRIINEDNPYMGQKAEWIPDDKKAMLARASIVELLPDPLSTFFESIAKTAVVDGMDSIIKELIKVDFKKKWHLAFPVINGYGYYQMRFGMWEYLKLIPKIFPLLPWMFKKCISDWKDKKTPKFLKLIDKWKHQNMKKMSYQDLLKGGHKLTDETQTYYTATQAMLPIIYMGEATFMKYYNWFVRRKKDPPFETFVMGYDSTPIFADKSLYDISILAKKNKKLADLLLKTANEDFTDLLNRKTPPKGVEKTIWKQWQEKFEKHLENFGHLVYDLDIAKAVPADNPEPLFGTMKYYMSGKGVNPHKRQEKTIKEREAATEKMLKRLGFIRRYFFKKFLRFAQARVPYREDGLASIGLAYPTARKLLLELGMRLKNEGVIKTEEEVYWLKSNELTKICKKLDLKKKVKSQDAVISDRKKIWEWQRTLTPPPVIAQSWLIKKMFNWYFPQHNSEEKISVMKGVGASKGVITGTARVILSPDEFDKMQPGDILVTAITTPAWTPLFALAGGVVTDVGGALSHSSIVAREYGIPAVLGTGVASKQIKSGQKITVDGDKGIVTLQ
ncbi:PEP/pyruvate-binding domain-containing protein [Patescibacteria group bacterium]